MDRMIPKDLLRALFLGGGRLLACQKFNVEERSTLPGQAYVQGPENCNWSNQATILAAATENPLSSQPVHVDRR